MIMKDYEDNHDDHHGDEKDGDDDFLSFTLLIID